MPFAADHALLPAICVRPADTGALGFLAAGRCGGYVRCERRVYRDPYADDLAPVQFDASVHMYTITGNGSGAATAGYATATRVRQRCGRTIFGSYGQST